MSASQTVSLYHMVEVARWREFQGRREPYLPPTYAQDGFIHLTSDPALLLTVANHFYTSSQGDWAVLVLDQAKLKGEVKWEAAAPVGSTPSDGMLQEQQPLFPHLYGPLDLEAVVGELPMRRDSSGAFLGIEGM